jgi:hypothetical protein
VASLAELPRTWWFPPVDALRRGGEDGGAYWAFPLDVQPGVGAQADPKLRWLERQPDAPEWGLDGREARPACKLVPQALDALVSDKARLNALRILARQPDLQRKIRSFTGCYLDLGDFAVPCDDGSLLLHFLTDQQWVRHWLMSIDADGSEVVVSSTSMIGFKQAGSNAEPEMPSVIPLDGSVDLSVTADSLEEFLYRFWVENEIAFRTTEHFDLDEPMIAYATKVN